MAQQNKSTLKSFFQTGDTPNANNYGELIDSSLNLTETALQIGEFSVSSSGNLKIMGSASFVGDITSSGDIKSTGAITCTSLNTGQGAYELFQMNQNVTTNDTVTFAGINFTKTVASSVAYGDTIVTDGQSFQLQINSIPAIAAGQFEEEMPTLRNASIAATSVIMTTCVGSPLVLHTFSLDSEACRIRIQNLGQSNFNGGNVVFNFTII